MLEDVSDVGRTRMRTELQIIVAERAPDGRHLVRLARVRVQHVLVRRIARARNSVFRNRDEGIPHWLLGHLSAPWCRSRALPPHTIDGLSHSCATAAMAARAAQRVPGSRGPTRCAARCPPWERRRTI